MADRVPPGRAGRLWLLGRLASAKRSADLLDHKRRLIRIELERLEISQREAATAFERASRAATSWGRRSILLGGIAQMTHAATPLVGLARVEILWQSTMGVTYPDVPRIEAPTLSPYAAAACNAAVAPAAAAYSDALEWTQASGRCLSASFHSV